jgi:hypothetical protein
VIGSVIGYAINPINDPINAYFSYEEWIADYPAEIEAILNEINYLILDAGVYKLYIT